MLGLVGCYSATLSKPHILSFGLASTESTSSFVEIYGGASAALRKVCSSLSLFPEVKTSTLNAIRLYRRSILLYFRCFLFHFFAFSVSPEILIILFFDKLCFTRFKYRLKFQTMFVMSVNFLI